MTRTQYQNPHTVNTSRYSMNLQDSVVQNQLKQKPKVNEAHIILIAQSTDHFCTTSQLNFATPRVDPASPTNVQRRPATANHLRESHFTLS